MLLQIHLPEREATLAFHRQRWDEVVQDPRWARCADRIETNAFGQIIMTPPADLSHGRRQFQIAKWLEAELGGRSVTECPIATADGVKAADAAWFSNERYRKVEGQRAVEIAPEICVEVISPRNSDTEMRLKRELYFDAGAIECWTCSAEGLMTYYHRSNADSSMSASILCPQFPNIITD
jgi:Uma2 family endonuclease